MANSTPSLEQLASTSKHLVRRLLTIGENRLELLSVEVQEGRERLLQAIMLALGVAAFGLLAGVGTSTWLYAHQPVWWLAGAAGALMGAVWNYSMSTLLVWRVK